MAGFTTRDPARPEFWDERFAAGYTPWETCGVPPALARFVAERDPALRRRVLVPGCGAAYEAALLDAAGFDVLAIDYSAAAIARAREALPADVAARVLRQADFFTFDAAPFDWIYERAFLAALPPALWPQWAARVAEVLVPDGVLAGFFFVDDAVVEPRRGPPFAVRRAELDALLSGFDCAHHLEIAQDQSAAVFAGRELWMTWRRRVRAAA